MAKKNNLSMEEAFAYDVKAMKLDDDNFPHSRTGLRIYTQARKVMNVTILLFIISRIFEFIKNKGAFVFLDNKLNGGIDSLNSGKAFTLPPISGSSGTSSTPVVETPTQPLIQTPQIKNVGTPASNVAHAILTGLNFATAFLFVVFMVLLCAYMYRAIKRHQAWETGVFWNDRRAYKLSKNLVQTLDLKQRWTDWKITVKNNSVQTGSKTAKGMTHKDRVERDMLKSLKKVECFVNTRKSFSSKELQRHYKIQIQMPVMDEVIKKVESELKEIDEIATRLVQGDVVFGKLETSANRGMKISRAVEEVEMKVPKWYAAPKKVNKKFNDKFEWTFPLDMLPDTTSEIAEKAKEAKVWAEQTSATLNMYFASIKAKVNSSEFKVSTTQAIYYYDMVFDTATVSFDKLGEQLDNVMKLGGISVSITEGSVRVIVPLPAKVKANADIPTLWKQAFENKHNEVTQALWGVQPTGDLFTFSIDDCPHLLICGQTKSGKSVAINQVLFSMMSHATPDKLKFIMIDPKKVEFGYYADSPYLKIPVIKDMQYAYAALEWACWEMDRRFDKLEELGFRNLNQYNEAIENGELKNSDIDPEMAYKIVIVIDEYSDLTMQTDGATEPCIVRLAQKARACGIHVMLATQRPSADVLSPLIKANIPTRMGLKVADGNNSTLIIDETGCENLRGYGDAYFKDGLQGDMFRIQCPYLPEKNQETILKYIKDKFVAPTYTDYLDFAWRAGNIVAIKADDKGDLKDVPFDKNQIIADENGEVIPLDKLILNKMNGFTGVKKVKRRR